MSWFFAAVYDRVIQWAEDAGLRRWRSELLDQLFGEVIEIGAGTGHNLAHYPAAVTRLVLAEPDAHMRAHLKRRLQTVPRGGVEVVDGAAERLPFRDATFDAVVSTLVLCSVADQAAALSEIRRVLRPGGSFVFLEHVAATDRPSWLWWQRRVEPVWRHLADNCHLTRVTDLTIGEAGLEIEGIARAPMPGAPPLLGDVIRGVARRW